MFSLVVKMASIRVYLDMAAGNWTVGCENNFPPQDLEEETYMQQPKSFEVHRKKHSTCKFKKSVYELKQAVRQWYKIFDSLMVDHEYKRTKIDRCDILCPMSSSMEQVMRIKSIRQLSNWAGDGGCSIIQPKPNQNGIYKIMDCSAFMNHRGSNTHY